MAEDAEKALTVAEYQLGVDRIIAAIEAQTAALTAAEDAAAQLLAGVTQQYGQTLAAITAAQSRANIVAALLSRRGVPDPVRVREMDKAAHQLVDIEGET